jgi:hypothetical protein
MIETEGGEGAETEEELEPAPDSLQPDIRKAAIFEIDFESNQIMRIGIDGSPGPVPISDTGFEMKSFICLRNAIQRGLRPITERTSQKYRKECE